MSKKKVLLAEAHHFNHYSEDVDVNKININRVFNPDGREGRFILKNLPADLRGKTVLDIGCGVGDASVYFALRGAKVIGIDISPEIIKISEKLAKKNKVEKLTKFKIGDIQKLSFKAASFDIVHGRAILHHVDIAKALKEVKRVLKKGGIAIFSDPLDYNPFIKIYDLIEGHKQHSPDERRLNLDDLNKVKSVFADTSWIGSDIFSLPLYGLDFLNLKFVKGKVPLNWFERIPTGEVFKVPYKICSFFDGFLPKPFQLLAWRIVIICRK